MSKWWFTYKELFIAARKNENNWATETSSGDLKHLLPVANYLFDHR